MTRPGALEVFIEKDSFRNQEFVDYYLSRIGKGSVFHKRITDRYCLSYGIDPTSGSRFLEGFPFCCPKSARVLSSSLGYLCNNSPPLLEFQDCRSHY